MQRPLHRLPADGDREARFNDLTGAYLNLDHKRSFRPERNLLSPVLNKSVLGTITCGVN